MTKLFRLAEITLKCGMGSTSVLSVDICPDDQSINYRLGNESLSNLYTSHKLPPKFFVNNSVADTIVKIESAISEGTREIVLLELSPRHGDLEQDLKETTFLSLF